MRIGGNAKSRKLSKFILCIIELNVLQAKCQKCFSAILLFNANNIIGNHLDAKFNIQYCICLALLAVLFVLSTFN